MTALRYFNVVQDGPLCNPPAGARASRSRRNKWTYYHLAATTTRPTLYRFGTRCLAREKAKA